MGTARKIDPRQFAKQGASHRVETHLPREHQATVDEAIKAAELEGEARAAAAKVKGKGGRPKVFQEEKTVRLNLFIPVETAKRIRILAVEQGVSPSQLVDGWARRAEAERAPRS